jgi:hypothetical protein
MQPPQSLGNLPDALSEQAAIESWLTDMQAYQDLRGQTASLQSFIRQSCQ